MEIFTWKDQNGLWSHGKCFINSNPQRHHEAANLHENSKYWRNQYIKTTGSTKT